MADDDGGMNDTTAEKGREFQTSEVFGTSQSFRPFAIETNMGTYKLDLEVYLTVYLEERKICNF